MKHPLLVVSIALVLFSSCTFFQKQEAVPAATQDEIKPEKKTGLISSPEDQDLLSASSPFILVTDANEKVFLSSVGVNLKKYKRRRVEVDGTWNTEKTLFIVDSVTSLGSETSLKQQHQSVVMGITFTYPTLWSLKETKNVLGLEKITITPYDVDETEISNVDRIIIEKLENSKRSTAREWLSLDDKYQPTDLHDTGNTYQQSLIGGAQLDAVKKTVGVGETVNFYVPRDTYMYHFAHTTVNDSDKDVYRNAFYDIVASFEFRAFDKTMSIGTTTMQTTITLPEAPKSPPKTLTFAPPPAPPSPPAKVSPAPVPAPTPPPPPAPPSSAQLRQTFIDYAKSHIDTLAPEPASAGAHWSVVSLQFAFPPEKPDQFNALYVIYTDGQDKRKILLSITDQTKPESMTQVAYFKPGATTDWELASGTDTAKASDKSFVSTSSSQETVIKGGMQLLEARSYKIKIQYPAKWYWAYIDGGYNFSTKPVTANNEMVRLVKGEPSALTHFESSTETLIDVCIEKTAKYCLIGPESLRDTMTSMADTIEEN